MSDADAHIAQTQQWLAFALRDLQAGEWNLQASLPLYEDCLFHGQQAAEKSLKGWLYWNHVEFRKTHDMHELAEQCRASGRELDDVLSLVERFTLFVQAWRYPHIRQPEPPTREETIEILKRARIVFAAVCAKLPEGACPPGWQTGPVN